jgi:peptide/nickel transport system substrate-binding protein
MEMKSKKWLFMLVSMMLVFALFLTGCNTGETTQGEGNNNEKPAEEPTEEPSGPQQGGDLIVGSIGAPTLFNDLYSTDTASSDISGFIYNGLVTSNEKLEAVGSLAESWNTSEDGLTWTFNLKKGVKWHDGKDFTADDVVFTYSIPLSEDYSGARASSFEKIKSIKAIDQHTVEIVLSEPYAPFIWTAAYGILPKHILGDVPIAELGEHEFNTKNPIGTGPFKFVEWKEGQYVKVEANEDYFEGRPYLDSITYKIVPDQNALLAQKAAGDVHHIAVSSADLATAQQWESEEKVNLFTGPSLAYTYLGYNQKNELFQDKKVRQALTHAIDREAIVEAVLNGDGQLANTPGSPISWAFNKNVPVFDYDVDKAKAMLAEAGWEDTDGDGVLDKDGKKFSFEVKTNQGNKAREQIATIVQQQFKEVGIEAKPKIMEWSAFIGEVTAPNWKYDAVILGWSLGTDPDPSDIFHSKEREEGLNFVHYSNPEMDALMDENTKILDQEERAEVIKEIQAGIAEDQPYSFLYYPNDHYATPKNLNGVVFHPSNPYYNVHKWWFKTE